MLNTNVERRTYSIGEVATSLAVSEVTVFRLLKAGALASIKIGGRRLVTREDLDAFVAKARTAA